jgi:hypothetical protein
MFSGVNVGAANFEGLKTNFGHGQKFFEKN